MIRYYSIIDVQSETESFSIILFDRVTWLLLQSVPVPIIFRDVKLKLWMMSVIVSATMSPDVTVRANICVKNYKYKTTFSVANLMFGQFSVGGGVRDQGKLHGEGCDRQGEGHTAKGGAHHAYQGVGPVLRVVLLYQLLGVLHRSDGLEKKCLSS